MIVADVNVVVHLLTEAPRHDHAARLWSRDPDWRLPPSWRHEFLNVLATFVRGDYVLGRDAEALWQRATALLGRREVAPDPLDALRFAVRQGISAYDAQYAVLALDLGVALVTEDRRLRRAVGKSALSMAEAVDL